MYEIFQLVVSLLGEIFSLKTLTIPLLPQLPFSFFPFINNLSKNFLTYLSMKNNGKEFLCHADFKSKIS